MSSTISAKSMTRTCSWSLLFIALAQPGERSHVGIRHLGEGAVTSIIDVGILNRHFARVCEVALFSMDCPPFTSLVTELCLDCRIFLRQNAMYGLGPFDGRGRV